MEGVVDIKVAGMYKRQTINERTTTGIYSLPANVSKDIS